jgi:glycosyltransferase involved in cell wall biosynthesis
MRAPSITVVMSVYNGEKYLAEAIQSVIDQTFTDFEFVIIDDGSNDNTLEIIQSFMSSDSRIVLRSRKNKGLVASLNEGLAIAKGKYVARMDADDISLPTRFEKQFSFLENNFDIGVCGSWIEVFGENFKKKLWKMPTRDEELKPKLLFSVPFAHPSVMIRKNIIDQSGLRYKTDYKDAEDYKFWLDLSTHTQFSNIPEVLIRYRYHKESISHVADYKCGDERFQTISSIQKEVLSLFDVKLSPENQKNHFIVALNERVKYNCIDLTKIREHFKFLLKSNQKHKIFNQKSLYFLLARKYFVVTVLAATSNRSRLGSAFFSGMFILGFILTVKNKVN